MTIYMSNRKYALWKSAALSLGFVVLMQDFQNDLMAQDEITSVDFMGKKLKFIYNEKFALETLSTLLGAVELEGGDDLKLPLEVYLKKLGEKGEKRFAWERYPSLVSLGQTIVCIGENSKGSKEVQESFEKISKEIGFLALPEWICFKEQRQIILMQCGYTNVETGEAFNLGDISSETVSLLIARAKKQIQNKSGFKFDESKSPTYSNP